MKNLRIEVKLTAIVHAGDDIEQEGPAPTREPDAVEVFRMARVVQLGRFLSAGDAMTGHLALIMANATSPMAERLRHELRQKNL